MKAAVSPTTSHRGAWLDRLGVSASLACAAHCVALTLALALWPALWLRQRIGGIEVRYLLWLEWGLALASLLLAASAAWQGWRRHRTLRPAILLGAGALVLLLGVFTRLHFVPYWGTAIVVCAGSLLVAGHWLNLRHARSCVHH
jgi:hypothetical protein